MSVGIHRQHHLDSIYSLLLLTIWKIALIGTRCPKRKDSELPGVEPCRPKWFHIVLCLIMTTSCSLKTGIQNLSNYNQPLGIDEEPLRYWEGEVYTPRLIADHADLVFGIGYNAGKEEGSIEVDEFSRWPKFESHLWDLRLGTRLFPLGVRDRTVIPYVSGGIGYYEYDVETNTPTDDIDGA